MILFDLLKEFLSNKEYETEFPGPRFYGDVVFYAKHYDKEHYAIEHLLELNPDMDLKDNLSFRVRDYIIVLDGTRTIVSIWNFGSITYFWNVNDILENDLDYNILKYGKFLLTEIRF